MDQRTNTTIPQATRPMNRSSTELYENLVDLVKEINDFLDGLNQHKVSMPEGITVTEMTFGDGVVVNFEQLYYTEEEMGEMENEEIDDELEDEEGGQDPTTLLKIIRPEDDYK